MTGKRPPKLVIFDCDGVLVDSEKSTISCLKDNLSRHGLELSYQGTLALLSAGTFARAGEKAWEMGANLPDNWLESIYEELYLRLDKEVRLIPSIEHVLDVLDSAGIPYAVGSNGRVMKMEIMLRRVGLWPRLKRHLYSAQDLRFPKPAPDVYLKAASDFDLSPLECAVIEDSAMGARAATAAGIPCFGYVANTDPEKLAPFTKVNFSDMRDLPALLGL